MQNAAHWGNDMTITLLDGGMGQELIARSGDDPTPLWATKVMQDAPHIVQDIHADYFAAGAHIATANTYGLHRDRLQPFGLEDDLAALHTIACDLARAARDAAGGGLVAGALGPLGWSYSHAGAPPADAGAPLFAEICALQAPFVDLFLIETSANIEQTRAALMGSAGQGRPVWLGLSVDDADGTRLRSGEPLADVFPLVERYAPEAVLLNCSSPEAVLQGLPVIARLGLPFGGYANAFSAITGDFTTGGTTVAALSARTDMSPQIYTDAVAKWVDLGATIIGGCCEIGPAHIAALAERFLAPVDRTRSA